jgi:glyoxylase-like metal-dependent hydrolase (beta-lactamase superfamily II)
MRLKKLKMNWDYDEEIRIKKLEIPPYDNNCYIIACHQTGEAIIIDAPGKAARILAEVKEVNVQYILITHTHSDHISAIMQLRKKLEISVAVHSAEADGLPSRPDLMLEDGDVVTFGTVSLRVLHTPGHSPGSVCLLTGGHLFSGDTLFPGGPGNTQNPPAFKKIISSITQKLFVLPDDTRVYPGHGADTIMGKEKREFASFSSRPHSTGLCGDVLWLSS